ncbi:hypothetical protein CMK14_08050 [Candidatus Poribacteria bacterium]|nr:hypothetical protein [Candidatus Poribacteria bacterium]
MYGNWEAYGIEIKMEKHPITKPHTTAIKPELVMKRNNGGRNRWRGWFGRRSFLQRLKAPFMAD